MLGAVAVALAVAGERASQKLDFEFLKQRNVDPADGYVPEYRADHPVDPAPIVHQGGRGHDRGLQVALEDGGESGAGVPCSVEGFSAQAVEVGHGVGAALVGWAFEVAAGARERVEPRVDDGAVLARRQPLYTPGGHTATLRAF